MSNVSAQTQPSHFMTTVKNFMIGALSGQMGTLSTQIFDTIKSRAQLRSEAGEPKMNTIRIGVMLYNEGGVRSLYTGLDSALMRQAIYTTIRLGIYLSISDYVKHQRKDNYAKNLTLLEKSAIAAFAGGTGAFFGNPTDVALVRMQADGRLPPELRRNYRHVFNALYRMKKEEGFKCYFKGVLPTVVRAMAINIGILAPYDETKERLEPIFGKETHESRFIASMLAGFIASVMSLPFDNIRVKLQTMQPSHDGILPYKGIIDCALKTYRKEGFMKFWSGFFPFYMRVGPYTVVNLISADIMRELFR